MSFLVHTFETLAVWALVVKGCEFVWQHWGIRSPEVIWAYTVATGMAVLYLGMFLCFMRQATYQARIDEMAEYKAKLENEILKKRQSSKKPRS